MGGSLYFYVFTSYMQKLLINTAKLDATTTSVIMTAALASFMVLQPLFGMLSDRIGIKNNMLLFTGLATLGVVPLLSALAAALEPLRRLRAGDDRPRHRGLLHAHPPAS